MYQPVRKCHLVSSLLRPSALRSVSRQEVTNDMVQISQGLYTGISQTFFWAKTLFYLSKHFRNTYVMWPLIYQIKLSATRSLRNQIKCSYNGSYMENVLNYDQIY
jgi:hypothetical protein